MKIGTFIGIIVALVIIANIVYFVDHIVETSMQTINLNLQKLSDNGIDVSGALQQIMNNETAKLSNIGGQVP